MNLALLFMFLLNGTPHEVLVTWVGVTSSVIQDDGTVIEVSLGYNIYRCEASGVTCEQANSVLVMHVPCAVLPCLQQFEDLETVPGLLYRYKVAALGFDVLGNVVEGPTSDLSEVVTLPVNPNPVTGLTVNTQ